MIKTKNSKSFRVKRKLLRRRRDRTKTRTRLTEVREPESKTQGPAECGPDLVIEPGI